MFSFTNSNVTIYTGPNSQQPKKSQSKKREKKDDKGPKRCYVCNKKGHLKFERPVKAPAEAPAKAPIPKKSFRDAAKWPAPAEAKSDVIMAPPKHITPIVLTDNGPKFRF